MIEMFRGQGGRGPHPCEADNSMPYVHVFPFSKYFQFEDACSSFSGLLEGYLTKHWSQSLYFTHKESEAGESEVMSLDHTDCSVPIQLDRSSRVILLEIHGKSES